MKIVTTFDDHAQEEDEEGRVSFPCYVLWLDPLRGAPSETVDRILIGQLAQE